MRACYRIAFSTVRRPNTGRGPRDPRPSTGSSSAPLGVGDIGWIGHEQLRRPANPELQLQLSTGPNGSSWGIKEVTTAQKMHPLPTRAAMARAILPATAAAAAGPPELFVRRNQIRAARGPRTRWPLATALAAKHRQRRSPDPGGRPSRTPVIANRLPHQTGIPNGDQYRPWLGGPRRETAPTPLPSGNRGQLIDMAPTAVCAGWPKAGCRQRNVKPPHVPPHDDGVLIGDGGRGCRTELHGSAWDDPVLLLTGDLGDAVEVGVVVQHGQAG